MIEGPAPEMKMSAFTRSGLIAAVAVIALDQATKWWIVTKVMQPPRGIPVTSFFNLVMGWNRGVSFGMFNNHSDFNVWFFSGLSLFIVAVLAVWLYRVKAMLTALAIGLVIGGALGNVVDRLRFGAVADFLDFHVAGYHWPAFNVADASITVGAVVLVLESLFGGEEKPK